MRKFLGLAFVVMLWATSAVPTTAFATMLDFNGLADGTPFTGPFGFFLPTEYSAQGVVIATSQSPLDGLGRNVVQAVTPFNAGLNSFSGFHLSSAGIAIIPQTFIDFTFLTPTNQVDFDFADFFGEVLVSISGPRGIPLGTFSFTGTDSFFSQSGAGILAGHASIRGLGTIESMRVISTNQSSPNNAALFIDNLAFQGEGPPAVPEPSTILLFGTGLAGLLGWQYRKKQVK